MEKIKKFGYYLFVYALFVFWLFLFGYAIFMSLGIMILYINEILTNLSIKISPQEWILILGWIITIILFCIPIKYFMRIKHKETAKIKDIILAIIFVLIDYLSLIVMLMMLFGLIFGER